MSFLTELKKALTSAGDGAALVPYDLEAVLHEELLKLQPLAQLLDILQAEAKTHEYTVRSSHPQAWFEGESTKSDDVNSVYQRKSVQLKIQRLWGSVTGFAQAVDERFVDALATELVGSVQGMADLMEFGALFGAADDQGFTGDAYQYSGILPIIYANAPANVIDAGGDKIALDDLDAALAKAAGHRQTRNDPKLWIMGVRMKQVVDGLQTKVQLPLQTVELADGKLVMAGYAGAPILESDYMVADAGGSPTPSASIAAGGTIPDGQYTYRISSVTMYGEQVGGTASGSVTAGTGNNTANLTWTADPNAKLYMIWRKKSTDTAYSLIDIINAKTYDATGKVNGTRSTYSDTGAKAAIAVKPLEAGEQMIALINTNPQRGAAFVGKIDDMGRPIDRAMSFVELARVKDSYDYMLKAYMALRSVYGNTSAVVRHAKIA